MKVTVKLSEWYAFGNIELSGDEYNPMLQNRDGFMCCLGFCALSRGLDTSILLGRYNPWQIWRNLSNSEWMIHKDDPNIDDSQLALIAMALNDGSAHAGWKDQPLFVRMGNLITVFAEGGDDLEFIQ